MIPPPRVTLLLGEGIRTGQANICNFFHMKTTLKLKINKLRAHPGLNIYLLNTINRPPQSRETIPLKTGFPPDHPPPRRRATYRRSLHMLIFTYEDDIKIKNYHVAGISRTFYLSTETISRPPQSRETIPLTTNIAFAICSKCMYSKMF
jgi:hypothetical protein